MEKSAIFLLFLIISFAPYGYSQRDVVVWDFSGLPGNQQSTPPTGQYHGFTGTDIVRGPGIAARNAQNSMNSSNWEKGESPDPDGYYSFSVTAPDSKPSFDISLTFTLKRSGTGPKNYEVKGWVDGGTEISIASGELSTDDPTQVKIQYEGLPANASIEFRIYGYNSGALGGTLRLQNSMILPVLFSSFDARLLGNKTYLTFSTATEINNDYFTIERSGDSRYFESIGTIKGAGNSACELYYSFTDHHPKRGKNYYRIKQTDFDGRSIYSLTKEVQHSNRESVTVFPTMTTGSINISLEERSAYNVRIFNAAGREMARMNSLAGFQTINIESIPPGLYYLNISFRDTQETVKIVKN